MKDEDLFAEAMRKVQPMRAPARVTPRGKPPRPDKLVRISQATVVRTATPVADVRPQPGQEPWVLLADGVSREQLKKLAAGQPPVAMELDLHGMTRDEALAMLAQKVKALQAGAGRVLCIIHGRGRHSQGRPVLKEAVYHWLREGPCAAQVLAVVPQRGTGGGSCLVLLRRQKV